MFSDPQIYILLGMISRRFFRNVGLALGLVWCGQGIAGEETPPLVTFVDSSSRWIFDTGVLAQVGDNTSIDYVLVPSNITWVSAPTWEWALGSGSQLSISTSFVGHGTWIAEGPETFSAGLSAAPWLEWVAASENWGWFASVGGGVGVIDSAPEVEGGQGQAFHFQWFAKGGVFFEVDDCCRFYGGPMLLHISNGGQTDPNPGIAALGGIVGLQFSW